MQDLGCQNFDDIVQAVESGHADYGFLPIENTSSGSINEVYDVLQHTSLAIVGETTIEVGHCLLAKAGSKLADIKTVYAHPQPISQCSRYLSRHPDFRLEYCASSAEAMEKVLQGDNTVAAIGSSEAAPSTSWNLWSRNWPIKKNQPEPLYRSGPQGDRSAGATAGQDHPDYGNRPEARRLGGSLADP